MSYKGQAEYVRRRPVKIPNGLSACGTARATPSQVGAGMSRHDSLLQSYGLREIDTGIGLLFSSNPRLWLWG
jgi:hypothetical protein